MTLERERMPEHSRRFRVVCYPTDASRYFGTVGRSECAQSASHFGQCRRHEPRTEPIPEAPLANEIILCAHRIISALRGDGRRQGFGFFVVFEPACAIPIGNGPRPGGPVTTRKRALLLSPIQVTPRDCVAVPDRQLRAFRRLAARRKRAAHSAADSRIRLGGT